MGFFTASVNNQEVCNSSCTDAGIQSERKSSTFLLEELEDAIDELLTDSSSDEDNDVTAVDAVEPLPREISRAAANGDEETVFGWLGLPPIPSSRMEATYRGRTLLHEAVSRNQTDLMKQLLQLGANVESRNSLGFTPLEQALCQEESDATARLLLTWGARIEPTDVIHAQNKELVQLLQTPLGGRRCEILGLKDFPHFNGQTGVVIRVIADHNNDNHNQLQHVLQLEDTDVMFTIQPANLKRRDQTPHDFGVSFNFPRLAPRLSQDPMEEWGIFPNDEFDDHALMMPMFDDDDDDKTLNQVKVPVKSHTKQLQAPPTLAHQ